MNTPGIGPVDRGPADLGEVCAPGTDPTDRGPADPGPLELPGTGPVRQEGTDPGGTEPMTVPGTGAPPCAAGARVDLRALGPEDVEQVSALEAALFPEDPWTRTMVAEELSAPGRHYVGAELEGRLIGYAGILIGPDADVMTIGVLPDHRGRGVGTLLLEDILDAARTGGSERVFLEVRASNGAAQGLYLAHGFHRIGKVRHYFRNPREDAVTMRLDLGGTRGAPIGVGN